MTRPELASLRLKILVLRDLAARPYPRDGIGATAAKFNLPAAKVHELVDRHGYPNRGSMERALSVLERKFAAAEAGTPEPATRPTVPAAPAPEPEPEREPIPEPEPTPAPAPISKPEPILELPTTGGIGQTIAIDKLIDHPLNPAERIEDVAELADSIKESGVIQPLLVTPHRGMAGYFLVLGGHRRKHAARRAGLTSVPCTVQVEVEDVTDERVLMLVENVQRKDLNAMQKAEAFGELRDQRGLTQAEICRRTGLGVGTVAYYLSLLDLDASSRERVRNGEVQVGQAVEAVRQVRRSTRKNKGQGQAGRPVIVEAGHFTDRHPLARRVREACTHSQRPLIGQVGCGQCWEQAIRDDAKIPEGTWS